jgi:hypothetical protein
MLSHEDGMLDPEVESLGSFRMLDLPPLPPTKHSTTSQKTLIFSNTTVRILNLACAHVAQTKSLDKSLWITVDFKRLGRSMLLLKYN